MHPVETTAFFGNVTALADAVTLPGIAVALPGIAVALPGIAVAVPAGVYMTDGKGVRPCQVVVIGSASNRRKG